MKSFTLKSRIMVIVMVSNDEIRRRLLKKRGGSPQKELTEDWSVSSEELKQKFREKRGHEKENTGYLVCDSCGGYYELHDGESPKDFTLECECGGRLEHRKTVKNN